MRDKLTSEAAERLGRVQHDPKRFAGREDEEKYLDAVNVPLGAPSKCLDEHERVTWEAFKKELPWLMERDRAMVEMAARLRTRLNKVSVPHEKTTAALRAILVELGASPSACRRIALPVGQKQDDPADKFFAGLSAVA